MKQLRQNAIYIPTNRCSSILNSSGDVTRWQTKLLRSPPNQYILVPPVHLGAFSILENKRIGDADDSTLLSVVPSPGVRVIVAESLNRDLRKVSEWCDH